MTVITHRRTKSRLATMIDQAGGISVGTALARAQGNLESLREQAMERIRESIAELSALPLPVGPEASRDGLVKAYQASSGIIDAAGPFELDDLCAASANLCDLIDVAEDGQLDWRIVSVHARALQLLIALPTEAQAEREAVLQNLKQVLLHRARQAS